MADFNPNTPTIRGMEWRPDRIRQWLGDSPNKGLLLRFKNTAGAVAAPNIDQFFSGFLADPGMAAEILTSPTVPAITKLTYYPATATGAVIANWQNFAGGALLFSDLDDNGDTNDGARNTAAIAVSPGNYLQWRSLGPNVPANSRIVDVRIKCVARLLTSNGKSCVLVPSVNIAGANYELGGGKTVPADSKWRTYNLCDDFPIEGLSFGSAYLEPTGTVGPWTLAQVNAIVNGTDEWGLVVYGLVSTAQTLQIASLILEVRYVAETRMGSGTGKGWYSVALPPGLPPTWDETSPGGVAMVANTWYWLHIFPFIRAGGGRYFTMPIIGSDPTRVIEAQSAAETLTEHRKLYETIVTPNGVLLQVSPQGVGEFIPALFETAAAISSQSQPYVELDLLDFYTGALANTGTEITTAAATNYDGISLVVGWQDQAQRPDAPLVIEVRSGAGGLTGAGVLVGTASIQPTDLATGGLQEFFLAFAAGVLNLALNTQYFVRFSSTATNGKGWRTPVLDTRTDITVGIPTVAEIQGATQGGTTDSYFTAGVEDDRYDMAVAFVQRPVAPAGITATPQAGA